MSVRERGRSAREHFLRLVDLGTPELLQARNLVKWEIGEQAQEAADIRILRVAPELPIIE